MGNRLNLFLLLQSPLSAAMPKIYGMHRANRWVHRFSTAFTRTKLFPVYQTATAKHDGCPNPKSALRSSIVSGRWNNPDQTMRLQPGRATID